MEISEGINIIAILLTDAFGKALIIGPVALFIAAAIIATAMYFDPRSDRLNMVNIYRFTMIMCFAMVAGTVLLFISSVMKADPFSALCWVLSFIILASAGRMFYDKMKTGTYDVIKYESSRQRIELSRANQLDDDDLALGKIFRDET